MAAMIRYNKKATKIAWALLGVPANIKHQKSAFSKDVQRKLASRTSSRYYASR